MLLIFPFFFFSSQKKKKQTNKIWCHRPTKCSRILMTLTHRAVWACWWCIGDILPGLYKLLRGASNSWAGAADHRPLVLTSTQGSREKQPNSTLLLVPVFCIISISRMRQSISQPPRFTIVSSTWTSMWSLNIIKSAPVTDTVPALQTQWWGTQSWDLPSGAHVLVCSKQIKPQRVTNSGERCKGKERAAGKDQGDVRTP